MSHPHEPESLQPLLEAVEEELEERLEEVCAIKDVSGESTGEFIRLEEKLIEAAQTAKQAFSLRRRLRAQREGTAPGARGTAANDGDGAVRTVKDGDGAEWRVWAVTPRMSTTLGPGGGLGDYQHGWLAFETTDGRQRRRLPLYPGEWERVSSNELLELLARAEPARPTRRNSKPDTTS